MTMMRRTGLLLVGLGLSQIAAQLNTELGGGVVTRTNQDLWASLPLDIRIINERIESSQNEEALEIYLEEEMQKLQQGSKSLYSP